MLGACVDGRVDYSGGVSTDPRYEAMAYVPKDDLVAIALALEVPGDVKEAAGSEVLLAIQRLLKMDRQPSSFVISGSSHYNAGVGRP